MVVTRAREPGLALVVPAARARRGRRRGAGHRDRRTGRRRRGAARRRGHGVGSYDWLVLTSVNGVDRFFAEIPDARALGGVQVAAIGPRHGRRAAGATGWSPTSCPSEFVAESLLDAMPAGPTDRAGRVLLARAAVARDVLPDGLRARGWEVDVVEAYRTVPAAADPRRPRRGRRGRRDHVHLVVDRHPLPRPGRRRRGCRRPSCASGPVTAETARAHGLGVTAVADEHTIDGLVDALAATLRRVSGRAVDAVVFDFDGLLVDTEWSIYEMAAPTFAEFDIDLAVPVWATIVGLAGESDWWGQLCAANGWDIDRDEWWRRYDALDRSFRDHLPALPGVVDLLDDARGGRRGPRDRLELGAGVDRRPPRAARAARPVRHRGRGGPHRRGQARARRVPAGLRGPRRRPRPLRGGGGQRARHRGGEGGRPGLRRRPEPDHPPHRPVGR